MEQIIAGKQKKLWIVQVPLFTAMNGGIWWSSARDDSKTHAQCKVMVVQPNGRKDMHGRFDARVP
jgi:hypothetical protein